MGIHEDTLLNLGYGINEQSFTAGHYRKMFRRAGLKMNLLNPRWDTRREGDALIIKSGTALHDNPHVFNDVSKDKGLKGKISRWLSRSGIWRIATHPRVFPFIRFQVSNWVQTEKIIVAKKPPVTGNMVTEVLWLKAVIQDEASGPVEAAWKKGGEAVIATDTFMIWGYFHANPNDVSWGDEENPDVFVKIQIDREGTFVDFFHVSVPDINVFSDCPYDDAVDKRDTTTMTRRHVRQSYETSQRGNSEPKMRDSHSPHPAKSAEFQFAHSDFRIRAGAVIHTDQGTTDATWHFGGQNTLPRGDQSFWGYFCSGKKENPDVFVKLWLDACGSIDVNFFQASASDIEVHSKFSKDDQHKNQTTRIADDKYVRHVYWK